MKKTLFMACLTAGACNSGGGSAKSIFALDATDFNHHNGYLFSQSGLTAQSGSLSSLRQALSDGGTVVGGGAWKATGLTVSKGDVLYIQAAGVLSTTTPNSTGSQSFKAGPDGDPEWTGGTTFNLPGRSVLGLFGRVNGAIFPVGSEAALLAPDSGAVELLINDCMGCTTSGELNVTLNSDLKSSLASEPLITDNSVSSMLIARVEAGADWLDTGLMLDRGTKVFIDAAGMVSDQGGSFDANGASGVFAGTTAKLPSRNWLRLYGRINGRVFELGKSAAFLAPASGKLELVCNSAITTTGSFVVTIQKGVRPARGLPEADPSKLPMPVSATVKSDLTWLTTMLTVERGDPLAFQASGAVSGAAVSGGSIGPYGSGVERGGTSSLLPGYSTWSLFARIGRQEFYVGESHVTLAPASGSVELAINGQSCGAMTPCPTMGQFNVTLARATK